MREPIMPAIKANEDDVIKAAIAIFHYRQKQTSDPEPNYRHPMLYKDKEWRAIPATEQMYYCEMAMAVFRTFRIQTPTTITLPYIPERA
jgi:hypothetical protein